LKLFEFFEERMDRLGVSDIALIKSSVFAFTLLLVKFFPILIEGPVWLYVVLFVVFAVKPIYVFYIKK
jgi:hypothetical protein